MRQRRHDARALGRNPDRPSPRGNLHPGRRRREARILEGCVAITRVGSIVRVAVFLLGMARVLRGFGREDSVWEAGILEGVRGAWLRLVCRLGRNWARLAWSLTARLGLRLRLVALAWVLRWLWLVGLPRVLRLVALLRLGLVALLRLRLVALLRLIALRLGLIGLLGWERIREVRSVIAPRRSALGVVGRSGAILVRIARYPGHLRGLWLYALPCIGAIVRSGWFRRMRLRLRRSRDRLVGGHLRKSRPAAGSENRALSRHWLARSAWSRSHKGILAPMSCVCVRGPGLIALGADAPKTVGEIGLKLKGRTDVVPVPLIVHGHGTSPEPSPPPRLISPFNASRALP